MEKLPTETRRQAQYWCAMFLSERQLYGEARSEIVNRFETGFHGFCREHGSLVVSGNETLEEQVRQIVVQTKRAFTSGKALP